MTMFFIYANGTFCGRSEGETTEEAIRKMAHASAEGMTAKECYPVLGDCTRDAFEMGYADSEAGALEVWTSWVREHSLGISEEEIAEITPSRFGLASPDRQRVVDGYAWEPVF